MCMLSVPLFTMKHVHKPPHILSRIDQLDRVVREIKTNRQRHRTPRFRPTLRLNPEVRDLFAFRFEDITLEGYNPHPHIKARVSV